MFDAQIWRFAATVERCPMALTLALSRGRPGGVDRGAFCGRGDTRGGAAGEPPIGFTDSLAACGRDRRGEKVERRGFGGQKNFDPEGIAERPTVASDPFSIASITV